MSSNEGGLFFLIKEGEKGVFFIVGGDSFFGERTHWRGHIR